MRLFKNETKEWYHVHVNGEEIVCTGGHPFYIVGIGFMPAKMIKPFDKVLLSNGNCVKIDKIEIERLSSPETTYNFEVEDFHTYYVTDGKVLVHNRCKLGRHMERAGKHLNSSEDAHHLYPQKFAKKFLKIGIKVDDAVNGIAMDHAKHIAGAQAYNKLWAQVIDSLTNPSMAEMYMKQFMETAYGIVL